jgi:hypothetical protein
MTQHDPELKARLAREAVRRGQKIRRRRRRPRLGLSVAAVTVAAAAAVAVGLAASAGHAPRSTVLVSPQTRTSTSPSTSLPQGPTPAGPAIGTCQAHDLAATLTQEGAASGHVQYRVALTAAGTHACRLDGYAQVTAVDVAGGPVAVTNPSGHVMPLSSTPLTPGHGNYLIPEPPSPSKVQVAPGQSASFDFTYEDNPVGAQTTCPDVSRLQIQLPGDGSPIVVQPTPALPSVCDSFQVEAIVKASSISTGS